MTYTVLARRHRPRDFGELVGQDHIVQTLENAIASGRVAHAYLFCGTRGVGKTSMARIFAAAINHDDGLQQAEEIRNAVFRGEDLDVIEIDGASHRGVNEARELIAGAGLSPTRCAYKVYIIDEVHMLTKEAFNTLLKTMEEPPSHVKFILCTTSPREVPATIQSRCQRFDFRTIPARTIAAHLSTILDKEGIAAEEATLLQVATLGNGSLRDALSLLDRVIAGGEKEIDPERAAELLGIPDRRKVLDLFDAICSAEPIRALDAGEGLLAGGLSVDQVLDMLAEHCRVLMLISVCGPESDLLELADADLDAAAAQASRCDTPGLVHLIALCDSVARNARNAVSARALFDAVLVRMALCDRFTSTGSTVDQPAVIKKKDPPAPLMKDESPVAPSCVESQDAPALPPGDGNIWKELLVCLRQKPRHRALVDCMQFISFADGRIELTSTALQGASPALLAARSSEIAAIVKDELGRRVEICITLAEEHEHAGPSGEPEAGGDPGGDTGEVRPGVRAAMEIFQATVDDPAQ